MSQLRSPNENVGFSQHRADLALALVDPATRAMVEQSLAWDHEAAAENEAIYQAQLKRSDEIQSVTLKLAQLRRQLEEPGHTRQSQRAIEAQIKALELKLEGLNKRDAKRTKREARKVTSQMLAALAKISARPHKLRKIDLGAYAKKKPMIALTDVRAQIAALYVREDELYVAILPKDDAIQRFVRPLKRLAERAKAIPVGEAAHVHRGGDGRFVLQPIEIPEAALWDCIVPLATAHFADRVDAHYKKAGYDLCEQLTLADRQREQRELMAKLNTLELIEGELIRAAYLAGETPIVRPDMHVRNLFPFEVDLDAEFEEPEGTGFREVVAA